MNTILAPTLVLTREEWPDADFDIPDGEPLNPLTAESDKEDDDEDDMDWDAEMDLGRTGGAKAKAVVAGMVARSESFRRSSSNMITIRPPLPSQEEEGDDEDDEGVSTIKVAALPRTFAKPLPTPIEEDIESAFLLPTDLTQLSLAPLSLNHRSSKNSLEWGDKDQTSSSQSSDAYSTLGFADASPSSNSASSISSLPETEEESECDEDEGDLEGLVIPSGLFESGQGGKHLKKILELKKKTQIIDQRIKVASPDPEDDFEMGLVIDDDVDLSPSRLLTSQQTQRLFNRSKSMPARPPVTTRPPSRAKGSRAKSPINPPPSSMRQFQRLKLSPSPPLQPIPPVRTQTYKEALSNTPPASTISFLQPKPGSLRGQKSHSGLKPPTPPSTQRKQLTRKASLSSLMETSTSGASGSGVGSTAGSSAKLARYEAPTAASRAKSHTNSTSRIHGLDFIVPPTRPSTPSSNPAALRLTMPTSMRMKSRPALSAVFAAPPSPAMASMAVPSSSHRATSPLPPRPPSTASLRTRTVQTPPVASSSSAPKLLRRPKRPRTYGDGTELDGIDDLPTDREKEGRFRVQPKSTSRLPVPGNQSRSFDKDKERGTVRKKGRREGSNGSDVPNALTPSTNMLRRTGRIEFPSKFSGAEINVKKKKDISSPVSGQTKRKPTLIRHLGGANGPKVVGEMKWNPTTLRWEGNDQVLRDFDAAVGTSTRPALITHLTGSSIGSPVGSFAAGARKVGNMIFDPARMCWISTLPPDQEEPDVFADLADDEEEDWETKGGTIRASQQQGGTSVSGTASDTSASSSTGVVEAPSPARSHTRTLSESGSDRGSRASLVCDVDGDFVEKCRAAEERHRVEMKGWRMTMSSQADPFAEPDRSSLFEIRALATRKY